MHRSASRHRHEDASKGTKIVKCVRVASTIGAKRTSSASRKRGRVISVKTARRRSDDHRINLRRAYRAFMRLLRRAGTAGAAAVTSPFDAWPIRPYAASV